MTSALQGIRSPAPDLTGSRNEFQIGGNKMRTGREWESSRKPSDDQHLVPDRLARQTRGGCLELQRKKGKIYPMPLEDFIPTNPPGGSTIETRGRTTSDGLLNLSIPVGIPNSEVSVIVQVMPTTAAVDVDENGWPRGYFDQVAGSMPELERGSQGDFEQRLPALSGLLWEDWEA